MCCLAPLHHCSVPCLTMELCWLGLYPHLTLPKAEVSGLEAAWKLPSSYQESALNLSLDVFVAASKRLSVVPVRIYFPV